MMVIESEFNFGDIVYVKTDPEQFERQVVCLVAYKNMTKYLVTLNGINSEHFDFELTRESSIEFSDSY
jgi:hypothetical protein